MRNESLSFMVALGEVATTGQLRMPVAITGHWVHPATKKEFDISLSDLTQARENFAKKANGEINVDYDHASVIPNLNGGPRPSAGRVVQLQPPEVYVDPKRVKRQILWGSYEPTDLARTLIGNREYRFISPVLERERIDKASGESQGMTITSIALTNTPVLEEMPGIQICASEGGVKLMDFPSLNYPNTPFPSMSGPLQQELAQRIRDLMESKKVDWRTARILVNQEYPDLIVKAREEGIGRKYEYREIDTGNGKVTMTICLSEQMSKLAKARAREEGISFRDALSQVARENPELAANARAQTLAE